MFVFRTPLNFADVYRRDVAWCAHIHNQNSDDYVVIIVKHNHHLEFLKLCISDVIDMFQIEVLMFPLLLVTIGQRLKK